MTEKIDEYVWQQEAGTFVNERVRRVAELLNEYEPTLFIAPIPDQLRDNEPAKAFALVHELNGQVYCVRKLREDEIDESLIAWVWAHDNNKTNVLTDIEAQDAAATALRLKKLMEEKEEAKDIGATILKSPLHTYRHNGKKYS